MVNVNVIRLKNRFETEVDGHRAYLEYVVKEGYMYILRTYVPKPVKGKGIAGKLVDTACRFALSEGLVPKAECSFAAAWMERDIV